MFPAVDIRFDSQLGLSTAGGIQISGMKTSVANRRQEIQAGLVIEQYRFVPYQDTLASETDDLAEYQIECEVHLRHCLSKMIDNRMFDQLKNAKLLREHILTTPSRNSASSLGIKHKGNDKASVLNFLYELFDLCERLKDEPGPPLSHTLSEKLTGYLLMKDMLLNLIRKPRALKSSIDVFLQFQSSSKMKICEYNTSNGYLFADVLPHFESHPGILIEYTAFDPNPQNLDSNMLETYGVQSHFWDFGHEPPSELSDAVMVLAYHFSVSQADIQKSLAELASLMMDGALILLCESTKNFAIPLFLSGLLQDFSTITDERTCGPFCDETAWQEIIRKSGLKLISQISDGIMHTLFLCRKVGAQPSVEESTIIPVSNSSYDWIDEVKTALGQHPKKSAQHRIWLTPEGEPHSGIIGMVNCLKKEPNGNAIRLVLIRHWQFCMVFMTCISIKSLSSIEPIFVACYVCKMTTPICHGLLVDIF